MLWWIPYRQLLLRCSVAWGSTRFNNTCNNGWYFLWKHNQCDKNIVYNTMCIKYGSKWPLVMGTSLSITAACTGVLWVDNANKNLAMLKNTALHWLWMLLINFYNQKLLSLTFYIQLFCLPIRLWVVPWCETDIYIQ